MSFEGLQKQFYEAYNVVIMPFIALGVLQWNIREMRSTLCFMLSDSGLFSTSFMTHSFNEESKVFAFRYPVCDDDDGEMDKHCSECAFLLFEFHNIKRQ